MDEPLGAMRDHRRLAQSRADVSAAPRPDGAAGVRIPQYSLWQTLGVWAAAALPIGVLGWLGVPVLAARAPTRGGPPSTGGASGEWGARRGRESLATLTDQPRPPAGDASSIVRSSAVVVFQLRIVMSW